MTWDEYFLRMCDLVASKSKDRSTKVGCVVVSPTHEILSTGYNGFPRGVNDDVETRHERPAKYMYVSHAETNATFNAARTGVSLRGATLYLRFSPGPCHDCAKAIIQSGITEIVCNASQPFPGKGAQWDDSIRVAKEMLDEAGVLVRQVELNEFQSSPPTN